MSSAGCEPANLGSKGQHATSRPTKSLHIPFNEHVVTVPQSFYEDNRTDGAE
jgi:hypothetical protein